MKYTKIPENTFSQLQMNAGVLCTEFNPATGEIDGIIGATTGGVQFTATPEFTDFGEDIDNCPKNTMELKKITSIEAKMSGTFVVVSAGLAQKLVGAADIDGQDATHIVPRNDLETTDFEDIWWIGDYSDKNGETNGGYCAVHMMNALSTGGFSIQSSDKAKGQFAFEFTGHYSMNAQDTVPYEIYIKTGTPETGDYAMSVVSAEGTTVGYTAITVGVTAGSGESYKYMTGYSLNIPAKGTVCAGSAWSTWDGDDEILADSGMDIVVAIVTTADNKAVHAGKATVVSREDGV